MESNPAKIETFFFFHAAAMLLFCIKQRITFPKFSIFQNCKHFSLFVPIASGASVDPTSKVCSSTMSVLLIAGNCKVGF
jgi:hypothetical protein